jgi:hypothetical protein
MWKRRGRLGCHNQHAIKQLHVGITAEMDSHDEKWNKLLSWPAAN